MTDRELLKEARDALSEIHYGVTKEYWSKCKAIADRIDTALAEPDTTKMDAGQLVEKIRDYFLDDYDANFYMPFSVACALIEGYGRRVPRAWHEEIVYALKMAEKVCMDIKTRLTPYQFNTLTNVRKALDMMECIGIIDDDGVKIEEEGE